MSCPNCGEPIEPGDTFCGGCGYSLAGGAPTPGPPPVGGGIRCPTCGLMNEPDARFCERDATPLGPAAVPPGPPPPGPSFPPAPAPGPPAKAGVLVFPDNSEVRITASGKVFGKLDFATPSPKIPQNDLQFISRQHFTIYQDQDRFYVEDTSSTNNTLLNGEEIKGKGRRELKDGDEINPAGVAKVQFRIK